MRAVRLAAVTLALGGLGGLWAGCGGGDDAASVATTAATTAPSTGAVPATTPTATAATTGTTTGGGTQGDATAGKAVFASAGCGGCHTYSAAGSSGQVGPDLDQAKPSYDRAVTQVTNGGGGMPPFKGQLTQAQIQDVAAFVSQGSGG